MGCLGWCWVCPDGGKLVIEALSADAHLFGSGGLFVQGLVDALDSDVRLESTVLSFN